MRALYTLLCTFLISACSSSGGTISGSPQFLWPIKKGTITRGFKTSHKKHDGLDIAGKKNTPILATASGKVLYAGREFNGYGKLIIIEHRGDKWASFYGHLNGFKVREGQRVYKGQQIGYMGRTGRATGVHLHFEIRHNLRPVNPLHFLGPKQFLSSR